MRLIGVMVLVATVLTLTLAACGEATEPAQPATEAAPAATAAEVTPAATTAPATPTATEAPAPSPPTPTPQPTAALSPHPPITPPPPQDPARPTAVDFSLPSAQGPQYSLSSFTGQQPVVVVFYRAFW